MEGPGPYNLLKIWLRYRLGLCDAHNVLLLGHRLKKTQKTNPNRRKFLSGVRRANRVRTGQSGATSPGPTFQDGGTRTRELFMILGCCFRFDLLSFSPVEVTSKKPVTRRRKVVDVPKMVCVSAADSEVHAHTKPRKCGIRGSWILQESSNRICTDSRMDSSWKCIKLNFRR